MTLAYGLEVKSASGSKWITEGPGCTGARSDAPVGGSEKTKLSMFSRTLKETANEPALFVYGMQLSYFPHSKFLGLTFDHKFTFKKHFEDILERCQQNYHRVRMLVSQKWGPNPQIFLQIYKQYVGPVFEYGIIFTITVSDTVITKLQKLQNSYIKLALRLT